MDKIMKSPWTAVTLAIVAMTVAYTFYLKQTGALAASGGGYFCPAEELCKKAGCHGTSDCSRSECESCPFCNQEAS